MKEEKEEGKPRPNSSYTVQSTHGCDFQETMKGLNTGRFLNKHNSSFQYLICKFNVKIRRGHRLISLYILELKSSTPCILSPFPPDSLLLLAPGKAG